MLHELLLRMRFADPDFRSSSLIRLKMLEQYIDAGWLTADLRWVKGFLERS